MHIAFTGTKRGLSRYQAEELRQVLSTHKLPDKVSHGACIGADCAFHYLALELGIREIEIWPSTIPETNRAEELLGHFIGVNPTNRFLVLHSPQDPLVRNHDIIRGADMLVACPKEADEITRSGTWATVRLARKAKIPVYLIEP